MSDKIIVRDKVTKQPLIIIEGDEEPVYTEAYQAKKKKKRKERNDRRNEPAD